MRQLTAAVKTLENSTIQYPVRKRLLKYGTCVFSPFLKKSPVKIISTSHGKSWQDGSSPLRVSWNGDRTGSPLKVCNLTKWLPLTTMVTDNEKWVKTNLIHTFWSLWQEDFKYQEILHHCWKTFFEAQRRSLIIADDVDGSSSTLVFEQDRERYF